MSDEITQLKKEVTALKALLEVKSCSLLEDDELNQWLTTNPGVIPDESHASRTVKTIIENHYLLDFKPELNTSSYVNVRFEPEEKDVAMMGLRVNLADQTVYPQSYKIHDTVVNMIARLWNCPEQDDFEEYGVFPGAGTVGSTEACLLAGLALKFRWRRWYGKRNGLSKDDVLREQPNIVISTCYQAAWEKLIKYIDIDCKLVTPRSNSFMVDPNDVRAQIDDHTIAVVCIMGNHYGGQYDPVDKINQVVEEVNKEHGFQVGIHVDAASGGFIAPFQDDNPPWDFRLNNVLSISASGHKYGESCCGTGWVVWRHRSDLSEHVAISVTYLGGKADSYTLNFSRPASGVYVQYYKLLRYGIKGYQECCDSMMNYAKIIRQHLKTMTYRGKPRFVMLDNGDSQCLPVVTAMLNPECDMGFDDIDFQHVLSQHRWYVSAYRMSFNHPLTEENTPLFSDRQPNQTMFRVVIKSNLTMSMVNHLLDSFDEALSFLDSIDWNQSNKVDTQRLRTRDQRSTNHC